MSRVNIRAILLDPARRKDLLVRASLAIQHREGLPTTFEQMAKAYDAVLAERCTIPTPA